MRINKQITITPGTPLNVVTGLAAAGLTPVLIDDIRIQPRKNGGALGVVFVMSGISPVQRVPTVAADLTSEIAAATATVPGGTYQDLTQNNDANRIWLDGDAASVVVVSYQPKV